MDKLPYIDQSAKYHKPVKSHHYTYSDLRHLDKDFRGFPRHTDKTVNTNRVSLASLLHSSNPPSQFFLE